MPIKRTNLIKVLVTSICCAPSEPLAVTGFKLRTGWSRGLKHVCVILLLS